MERRMGRIRVRGARALLPLLPLLLFFLFLPTVIVVPRAAAQEDASVTLELLSQTASAGPEDARIGLRVLARNDGGVRVGDLDVRLSLGPAFTSRTDYETW